MRLPVCASLLLLLLVLLGWFSAVKTVDLTERLNEILSNHTLVEKYCKCFLDAMPCPSQEARALKRMLPKFVSTQCERCSEKERMGACRILFTLQKDRYRGYWAALMNKYDPGKMYRASLKAFELHCPQELHVID